MSTFHIVYKELFNLGNFARVLFLIPKPLVLWLSIQYDTDTGLAIAQIYLIGILFISLSGTNAHRVFYQIYFGTNKPTETKYAAKNYFHYIEKITLQLIFIIFTLVLVISVIFWDSHDVVIFGITFGIAEKLNDEYNRFVQFKNNNKKLFNLSLSKLAPALLAAFLSYAMSVDLKYTFPILSLFFSIFINWSQIYFAIYHLIKSVRKSFFETFKLSLKKISEDISQISCIFIGITLINLEKWLLRFFSAEDLPVYMLYNQFASVLIVVQMIILNTPVRVQFINKNPWEIRSIKIGSPIISLISVLLGIALYFYNILEDRSNIGYFAFFFAAIIILESAYSECLYWRTTARARLSLDLAIVVIIILYFVVLKIFWPLSNLIVLSFAGLFCIMFLRFLLIIYLLNRIKVRNS
jgi:hypothetical protein